MKILIGQLSETWLAQNPQHEIFSLKDRKALRDLLDEDDLLGFDAIILPVGWWEPGLIPTAWRHNFPRPAIIAVSDHPSETQAFINDTVFELMRATDDCWPKNYNQIEAVARIEAIMRRTKPLFADLMVKSSDGRLAVDIDGKQIYVDGKDVTSKFSIKEAAVLLAIVGRRGGLMTRPGLYAALYSGSSESDNIHPKIIDVFVCKTRKKLARFGLDHLIATMWGSGFIFDPQQRQSPHGYWEMPEGTRRPVFVKSAAAMECSDA